MTIYATAPIVSTTLQVSANAQHIEIYDNCQTVIWSYMPQFPGDTVYWSITGTQLTRVQILALDNSGTMESQESLSREAPIRLARDRPLGGKTYFSFVTSAAPPDSASLVNVAQICTLGD